MTAPPGARTSAERAAGLAFLSAVAAALQESCLLLVIRALAQLLVDAWAHVARISARVESLGSSAAPAHTGCPNSPPPCLGMPCAAFSVCPHGVGDADQLASLHGDYVDCHRRLHAGAAGGAASPAEWEEALGSVDFQALLSEVGAGGGRGSVRLLKCTQQGACVGYVLYELRRKGPPRSRQHYCELVNIVVRPSVRGCGAGRRLFDALESDLRRTASREAADLRLYVAERNAGPRAWYRRMGFEDAGWQCEHVAGEPVRFLRMVRRLQ